LYDVVIIGCGIVGAAAAYELSKYDLCIAVLERENDVAMGATKANSAVIHAGYDPKPGSLMAKLDVEGAALAAELCVNLDIPHRHCGALVAAFTEAESYMLDLLHMQAVENGVSEVEILSGEEVLKLEPNLNPEIKAALHAQTAMIVDPWEYALALAETAVRNGAELHLECEVKEIESIPGGYRLQTSGGSMETRTVINAAGLYSDMIHNMVAEPAFTILPSKGEYFLLDKSEGSRVNRVIFQCPSKSGKGVLVAPTVHGNLIVGPGTLNIDDRDDVATTADELELVRSTAVKSVPGIDFRAVIRSFSGNRARTEQKDFIIAEAKPGFIDLAGIMSPGLTAAPAIAKMAVQMLKSGGLALNKKSDHVNTRKRVRFLSLKPGERTALIKNDPAYGRIICRCETITEGEIRDALQAPIPPRSIDAVKRRCGAGMGRCQGGFCGPRVLELLSEHYNCDPADILQDRSGTYILTAKTKGQA